MLMHAQCGASLGSCMHSVGLCESRILWSFCTHNVGLLHLQHGAGQVSGSVGLLPQCGASMSVCQAEW